jgi:hypothetical protein
MSAGGDRLHLPAPAGRRVLPAGGAVAPCRGPGLERSVTIRYLVAVAITAAGANLAWLAPPRLPTRDHVPGTRGHAMSGADVW